ncbi:MAG: 4Fe-4S dicluster domain-containing protein [Verrucomicrobia bacterium]|nr:4Fe-4S dicluster domain-containing protein [Verrucomicrobiota bacterium]
MSPPRSGSEKHHQLRLAGRWLALVAAVGLAWPGLTESPTAVILPALSPHVAIGSALALRSAGWLTLLAIPVLVLVMFRPRWFCHHACPTGLLQETLERLRPAAARPARFPLVGPWIVFLTLGGACLGCPLFLWLDPLGLFNGFLAAGRQPFSAAALAAGLGLPLLLVFALLRPRTWCRRICPLGATQDLLVLPGQWMRKTCRCEAAEPLEAEAGNSRALARRGFLGVCLGAGGALLLKSARGQTPPPLRPPGSLPESSFAGVCLRCGNCAQVCPSRIIQPDLGRHGAASLLSPVLRFEDDYCRENCHRCNQVCPSGALARLTLSDKRARVIGTAAVDLDLCLLAEGKECTACIRRCPFEALSIQTGNDGFSTAPRVDSAKCNGCGACQAVCPTRPLRAIRVTRRAGF